MTGELSLTGGELLELRALSDRYATAADERDLDGLANCFVAQGFVRVHSRGGRVDEYRGSAGFAAVIELLAGIDQTMHSVTTWSLTAGGPRPAATVYCSAHHISERDGTASDFVMQMRYEDTYARHTDGTWRLAAREATVLFTELRSVRR